MPELRYTLLSDGSSERALLPILTWSLRDNGVRIAITPAWADLRRLRRPPRRLPDRIVTAVELFPCDLLFVHRDAEIAPLETRKTEITAALRTAEAAGVAITAAVCVIPVRMQEAWFLLDEDAIRQAAGNPLGRTPLHLPAPNTIETLPDPKGLLHEVIRKASELAARRRRRFPVTAAVHRIADLMPSFDALRGSAGVFSVRGRVECRHWVPWVGHLAQLPRSLRRTVENKGVASFLVTICQ